MAITTSTNTIRFELFTDSDAKLLQKRFEDFMLVNKIGRKDIVEINYSAVSHNGFMYNIIMLLYEAVKPRQTGDEGLVNALKKRSGPRKGMKRGPYKKTREKLERENDKHMDNIGGFLGKGIAELHKKGIIQTDKEKEYYDKMDMVVVPARKQVKETDQY